MDEIEQIKAELAQAKLVYKITAEINQFKTGFLARTAHELRSPLSSIMSLHQIILADLCENPAEEREFINQAYQATQKLLNILDDIINVSKLESGRIPLKIETLSVNEILKSVVQFTRLQIANRNLNLEISVYNSHYHINADFERLRQQLISLVDTGINLISEGNIALLAKGELNSNMVKITLNIPCSWQVWQQKTELLAIIPEANLEAVKNFSKELEMSASMRLLLAKTIVEMMGGQLELIPLSPDNFTEINFLFPLVKPDFVTPE